MSERLPIPEFDDLDLRERIKRLRGLIAEETIETLKMVRLDHIVNPRGKLQEFDQQYFRAWVIAWLNSLETVICGTLAGIQQKVMGGKASDIRELVAQPERLLDQVEDIKRALEIILLAEPEMTPDPVTRSFKKPDVRQPSDQHPALPG